MVDANGNIQPDIAYQVSLPDTGKAGQPPYALGATLVIIYRLLAPTVPLTSVVIYDGAYAPSNTSQITTQPMLGFYQAGNDQGGAVVSKITHIVGNGQSNKFETVALNGVVLPSLYGASTPPFPGEYNGSWDNPTWFANQYGNVVKAMDSSATTVITPSSSNKGCVNWGATVLSTTVQDSDHDGLMDGWKANHGYCDAGANRGTSNQGTCPLGTSDPSWVALPGATHGNQDVFVQVDYMCGANPDGTANCDSANGGISYAPSQSALNDVVNAFSTHNVYVHIDPNHHSIPAPACLTTTLDADGNTVYCPFPGQAGVVGWESGFAFLKTQPLNYPNESACETRTPPGGAAGTGPVCIRRFQPGRNNSYHEVIFGVASAEPTWGFQDGSLTNVAVSGNTATFTTASAHGLVRDPGDTGVANGRVTISEAISNPSLNGTYLVESVPTPTTFTILTATGTAATYIKTTDPLLAVESGTVTSRSGLSDIGGAGSLITLGLWGVDGQTEQVQSGTLMHELGHSIGLTHGGFDRVSVAGGGYTFAFQPNCKSNYQSVMNYMFQVDLLDGVLDYSGQVLNTLNESAVSRADVLTSAMYPTTKWYAPNQAFGSPATGHCDGTPLLQTDQPMFGLQGAASSITWSANQDINFDGRIEANLEGYSDWANLDLRQVGATGNNFWVGGGALSSKTGGGALSSKTGGGALSSKTGGGALSSKTGGGVGEITVQAANSVVRTPSNLRAALTSSNTVLVNWTPPTFGQSLIAAFNIYRSVNGAAFSKPPYATFSVSGTPLPLPNTFTFADTKVACATYTYFVTTVLSDARESVPSNTSLPISVPCQFVGFLSPMSTAGTVSAPTFSGSRTLGNALPIKWEILDANGNPISDLSTLKLVQACPTSGSLAPPPASTVPPCVLIYSPLTGGKGSTTFRFSSPQFIVNWDTGSLSGLAPGFWTIELQLNDGSGVKATTVQF
jgi:hypothetical protein